MTVSVSISSSVPLYVFPMERYLCLEKEGLLAAMVTSTWFSSVLMLSRERVERELEVSGRRTAAEVFTALWITTGCVSLPHVHCLASYLTHTHILQISHSGTCLPPTPACPRDLQIMNESFLN